MGFHLSTGCPLFIRDVLFYFLRWRGCVRYKQVRKSDTKFSGLNAGTCEALASDRETWRAEMRRALLI